MSGPNIDVAALAAQLGGTLVGRGDVMVRGLGTLREAGPGDLTFIGDAKYAPQWAQSRAAAAIVTAAVQPQLDAADPRPLIAVANADLAMIAVLELFQTPEPLPDEGVHPTAFVHPGAVLGARVRLGPHVSVERGAQLGDDVVLQAGVRVQTDVIVGAGSVLHANVVVRSRCVIGRRVIVHQNAAIGADGFGYRPDPTGRRLLKVPHLGHVVLEDDVEIGANTCIDRGKFGPTLIGAGTKIDNLCQIGHNCRIGRSCVISGQAGLAGSVIIGDGVQIGGQAGVRDHVRIGAGARIGGGSAVLQDVPAGETWMGYPAAEAGMVKRQWVALRRLPELLREWRRTRTPADKP